MKTIRHISPLSVFKVSCIVYALLFACFGCLVGVLPLSIAGGFFTKANLLLYLPGLGDQLAGEIAQAVGVENGSYLVSLVAAYAISIVVFAFIAAVVMTVAVVIYNAIAGIIGGVEAHIE